MNKIIPIRVSIDRARHTAFEAAAKIMKFRLHVDGEIFDENPMFNLYILIGNECKFHHVPNHVEEDFCAACGSSVEHLFSVPFSFVAVFD